MNFAFYCVFCGQKLEIEEEYSGQQCECPICGKFITVPFANAKLEIQSESNSHGQTDTHRYKKAISDIKRGEYEEAFRFAKVSSCTEDDILLFLLEISTREQDYGKALNYSDKLIELHPKSSIGYRWKAEILDDGYGKTEESISCSTKAIELEPNDANAYVIRGNTKRWMNPPDTEGAITDYKTALKIDDNCGTAYSGLAWSTLSMLYSVEEKERNSSKFEELAKKTEMLFRKAMEMAEPENYGAFQGLAAIHEIMGHPENECLSILEHAIRLSPRSGYLYIQRANLKRRIRTTMINDLIQDYARGIGYSQDFSRISPQWISTLKDLLVSYCSRKDL